MKNACARCALPKVPDLCFDLALALAACALMLATAHAQDPPPEQVDQGREVYEEFCATCHGRDMVTTGAVTFDLRKFPKDDAGRFRKSVLDGKGPAMPPWRGKLSDEDVDLLWAFVRGGP
ncbi:MAG: c-type cytochrome [Xanthobacteraceae bacterium]